PAAPHHPSRESRGKELFPVPRPCGIQQWRSQKTLGRFYYLETRRRGYRCHRPAVSFQPPAVSKNTRDTLSSRAKRAPLVSSAPPKSRTQAQTILATALSSELTGLLHKLCRPAG